MNNQYQDGYISEFVQPLSEAENEFLQVLVTNFQLRSRGHGLELSIGFGSSSPAIWLRQAKTQLLKKLSHDHRQKYQALFMELLANEDVDYRHSDPTFPFRFGNGGTLPVVRVGLNDYYCLFFRDAHPMGWNIANGGANDLNDLLHPDAIIERELREELIIVEPELGRRYVFDWHNARLKDHPDFALANRLWMERFHRQNYPEFSEIPLPLKWLPAPDTGRNDSIHLCDSVRVTFGDDDPVYTGYGFLNITGEDFGIEFDRIAKLAVGPKSIFCDGEIVRRKLLNRVIGLFEVQRVNEALSASEAQFVPDRLFWSGQERTGDDVEGVIDEYLRTYGLEAENPDTHSTLRNKISLRLCPVTESVIRRYMQLSKHLQSSDNDQRDKPFDVFISFASEDHALAAHVYNRLEHYGDRRVFFSDVTLDHGLYAQQIDRALDTSWALVAVGSRTEHLNKTWVQYEWETFHNDILSGRKHPRTPFVAFVTGINPQDLPRPFRHRQAVLGALEKLDVGLSRLSELIRKP